MKTRSMTQGILIAIAGAVMGLFAGAGCQCCPLFDRYANVVDDANDTHLYFDRIYNPKLDITRMGKPDWCSPWNRFFCRRCCNNGCYDRFDDCYLYPPQYPYEFPSYVMPPPTVRTSRVPDPADPDAIPTPNSQATQPPPSPLPESNL